MDIELKKMKKSFIFIAAILVLASCVQDLGECQEESGVISFSASLGGETVKSFPVTQLSGNAGIIGYCFDTWSDSETPWQELEDMTFTFDGDMLISEAKPVKWTDVPDEKLRIYAYAPKDLTGGSVEYTDGGAPKISYTVPQDAQTDILTAINEVSGDFRENIPLTFDHILTALKFKAGFTCKVNSITLANVASTGTYTIGEGWSDLNGTQTYTIVFEEGKDVEAGDMITDGDDGNVLFMIPQTFDLSSTAIVTLEYDGGKTISASLKGAEWEKGRMITYTLNKPENASEYIYFDLAAGNVNIDGSTYSGYVFINGGSGTHQITGTHKQDNKYYVYQSSPSNKTSTGWSGEYGTSTFTLPQYEPVKHGDMLWSEWITDNTNVEEVIEAWDNSAGTAGAAISAGRSHTLNRIDVRGTLICNLTIDNLYSRYQHQGQNRSTGGITFLPTSSSVSELHVNMVGDSRFGCIHYVSNGNSSLLNKLILHGTGSLTVADVDFYKANGGYYSNHYDSVIGGSDNNAESWGIIINSGVIFAGSTKAENCSCIGAGGNGTGHVTINGGSVTAVASTTGTAIGGGIGFSDQGGAGYVHINGGNVYAYNFENVGNIPSSAIGGAGSSAKKGNTGTVEISGGNVYAYSALGTAIGGGSSSTQQGGNAVITIKGNATVIAKSGVLSSGIGGGTGGRNAGANGGSATINISGTPIIRTGSIGGGKTNNATGKIGSADITISGGDIQAQFVMAAGASAAPEFLMTGGLIRNSYTDDDTYRHIQDNGGAVYLEAGKVEITGGTIQNCSAKMGGAVYIEGDESTVFIMSGGTIQNCISKEDGGAVYLKGGSVILEGGSIKGNLANMGNGGGVCIVGGNFYMPDSSTASVSGNAAFYQGNAGGSGGGIYVTSKDSDVTVDILSGTITDNSSDRYGGGISIDMEGNENLSAKVTVGTNSGGPEISVNHTLIKGGGLYAKGANADIEINGGRIMDNTTSGYTANPNVANEGGMVTLNGGEVTHVIVTYNNNGAFFNGQVETAQQKIVTATNSIMVVPTEFKRLGYILSGWNTRPDGKGTTYSEGDILHLDSDTTIYAQWTLN